MSLVAQQVKNTQSHRCTFPHTVSGTRCGGHLKAVRQTFVTRMQVCALWSGHMSTLSTRTKAVHVWW